MKKQEKTSLKRDVLSFFGVIAIVAIAAIVYTIFDRTTALITAAILGVILFGIDQALKRATARKASAVSTNPAQDTRSNIAVPRKSSLTEKEIMDLVWGLWATEDPTETDYRDARMQAGNYRKNCAHALRKLGKEAIPYLERYADKPEVAELLKEIKR